jgi:hypothetical protein
MADTRSGNTLPTIFGFFLGLMVTAFVGVGVYTFYPPPDERFNPRITAIDRESMDIRRGQDAAQLSDDERARLQVLSDERNGLTDQLREANRVWARTSSIILIVFATLTMALSIVGAGALPVLSNGLLLGGLFTMLYGVGWIVQADTSRVRFWVIAVALVVTVGLGYLRFVRRGRMAESAPGTTVHVAGELEGRIRRLEERLDDAARALGAGDRP